MFPWSVTAMAGMPMVFAAETNSPMELTACKTLNWEWTCKCEKGTSAKAAASAVEAAASPEGASWGWVPAASASAKLAFSKAGAS